MSYSPFQDLHTIWWHEDLPPDLDQMRIDVETIVVGEEPDRQDLRDELELLSKLVDPNVSIPYIDGGELSIWTAGPITVIEFFGDRPWTYLEEVGIIDDWFYRAP